MESAHDLGYVWTVMIGLTLVSAINRSFFFIARREVPLPELLQRGLRYAPLAALAAVLRGWGCIVSAVADGAAAEAVLARGDCALWIFDYHLDHGDDGVALHARLAARGGAAPCLILSADQTGAVRVAAQEAGLPLLVKPLRPLALKSVLDRMLAARAARPVERSIRPA